MPFGRGVAAFPCCTPAHRQRCRRESLARQTAGGLWTANRWFSRAVLWDIVVAGDLQERARTPRRRGAVACTSRRWGGAGLFDDHQQQWLLLPAGLPRCDTPAVACAQALNDAIRSTKQPCFSAHP